MKSPGLQAPGVALICLGITAVAAGHEGLHTQVDSVTARLAANPKDAGLYIDRGELYRLHGDWDAALTDFERAGRLDPANEAAVFARGRLLVEAGWPKSGLTFLDRFLTGHPHHGLALWQRGRALATLERYEDAVRAYDLALKHIETPRPEHYLERARVCASAGRDHLILAIAGLDRGMDTLGPIVSLQLKAIEFELRAERYDGALRRIDVILAGAQRKEKWLARRGEILEKAKRSTEAVEAYTQALAALELLPARHRQVTATRSLEEGVLAALRRLSGGGADDIAQGEPGAAHQGE